MIAPVAIGVDNGGTWIRLEGLDARGRRVWSLKRHSPRLKQLPAFLKNHLQRFHGNLSFLSLGSRGVWKQAKRRALKRSLRGLAKKIVVMSDVEAAWLAAFKYEGIIVISGTGSIAYGKRRNGTFARAGGLGPEKGDEGSGYWIGKEWLQKVPSPPVGRERVKGEGGQAVRQVALLVPSIIRKAKTGNQTAKDVIREAQSHLSDLVIRMIKELRLKGKVPLSVSGSVLENNWFRSGFLRALRKQRIRFQFLHRKMDPATAAALFAQDSELSTQRSKRRLVEP